MSSSITVQQIQQQIKPLSANGFVRFFQRIGRAWLAAWYGFSDKHPKLAKIIYMLFFFVVFSQGVTIFQLLLFLFLPHAFGLELAQTEWFFPANIILGSVEHLPKDGQTWTKWTEVFNFFILGKPLAYAEDGSSTVVIGGGLGYFFSFLIATFLAQCINLPLQRNITFKSHGNPWYQAMWYFIGWILIQPFCDMIGSLWKYLVWGVFGASIPVFVSTLLDTVVMGGVSMAIFFFVFLIIFPDYNAVAKRTRKKLEGLMKKNAPQEKIAFTEAALATAEKKANLSNAEKAESKAKTQASAKAMAYFATVKNAEKAKASGKGEGSDEKIAKAFDAAVKAIEVKEEAIVAFAKEKEAA